MLVPVQLTQSPPDRSYDGDSDDGAISKSPFPRTRVQLPDLSARQSACGLGADARGTSPSCKRTVSARAKAKAKAKAKANTSAMVREVHLGTCLRTRMVPC